MAMEVRLPQLGQTMEEGTIVGCMVEVGDEVKKGDVIFEIETDKATLEMESPVSGFVKHILVELEQTLAVGEALLVLGDEDEDVPQSFIDSLKTSAPAAGPSGSQARVTEVEPELKFIAPEDTELRQAEAEIKPGATVPLTRRQKLIAEQMVKSKREIPCFYLTVKADVTDLVELRTKMNSAGDIKITYNDFIIKAVAGGLEEFPMMTGQVEGDVIKLAEAVNVGLAVEAPSGLIVPVVKNAHKKDIRQIAAQTKALIEKAQDEKLLLTDLEGACITVSNLGSLGIDSFVPIVIPGQSSILGVGRIADTCVPDTGGAAVRKVMNLTLAADHKIVNGAYAARFLDTVRKLLEDTTTFT